MKTSFLKDFPYLILRLTALNFPYSPLFRTPIPEKRGTSRLKKECDNVKVSVEIYRRSAQSPTRPPTTALHGTYTYLSKMRVKKVSSTHYLVHANQRTDLIDNCNQLKMRTKKTSMFKALKRRKKTTTGGHTGAEKGTKFGRRVRKFDSQQSLTTITASWFIVTSVTSLGRQV